MKKIFLISQGVGKKVFLISSQAGGGNNRIVKNFLIRKTVKQIPPIFSCIFKILENGGIIFLFF